MERYYSRNDTPLIFHTLVKFLFLPATIIYLLYRFLSSLVELQIIYNLQTFVDFLFVTAFLVFSFACLIGFYTWKQYSWRFMIALLISVCAYNALFLIIYIFTRSSRLTLAAGNLIAVLICSLFIGAYYIKRGPIFFDETPIKREISNKTALLISIIVAVCLFLISLFVHNGIWMNMVGTLLSPLALADVIGYEVFHTLSLIDLFISPSMFGVRLANASLSGLLGQESDWSSNLSTQCLISLLALAAVILVIVLSSKISEARIDTDKSAVPCIIAMWSCVYASAILSEITFMSFKYINSTLMLILAGAGSLLIYKICTREEPLSPPVPARESAESYVKYNPEKAVPEIQFCRACGEKLPEGSIKCEKCRTPVKWR